MRILYLIDEMEAITAGGTERQVLQMIGLMKASGAEVQLATLRGTAWLTREEAGCPFTRFSLGSLWSPSGMRELMRLRRWMRQQRFDVVQTFFVEANIIGPIIARSAGVPVILGSRRNLNYWMGAGARWLQRFSNRYATRLVANCEAVRQHIITSERFAPERVVVVYNGLDVSAFDPARTQRTRIREKIGIPQDAVVVGMVAALRPVKGTELFVRAASKVPPGNVYFVLVGDGPLRPQLETDATASGLGERFKFLGAKKDIPLYLQSLDLAVLCSESEGFSNSILEYLAAGLPVVATDVGGNREAVGDAGILVSSGDTQGVAEAMTRLATDSALRSRLATAALTQAQRFSLVTAQKALGELYSRLLEKAPKAPK